MTDRASAVRKRPFNVDVVIRRIRREVEQFPDAAMFDLRSHGYATIFQQLVACIISIRTFDEVSLPVSLELLKRAPTPEAMAKLTERQIGALISESTFHQAKARDIREIARRTVAQFGGELPADAAVLTSFRCSFRSASTCAPAGFRAAQPVLCWSTAGRLESLHIDRSSTRPDYLP